MHHVNDSMTTLDIQATCDRIDRMRAEQRRLVSVDDASQPIHIAAVTFTAMTIFIAGALFAKFWMN